MLGTETVFTHNVHKNLTLCFNYNLDIFILFGNKEGTMSQIVDIGPKLYYVIPS